MLKQCFALFLTCCSICSTAQNDLIVLTESGAFFTLFVNGEQVNDSAQSLVLARGIASDSCAVKLEFSDKTLAPYSGHVFLREKGKEVRGREFTYSLADDKGKRRLRYISVNSVIAGQGTSSLPPEARIRMIFEQLEKQRNAHDRANELYPPPANCIQVATDSTLARGLKELRDNHIELNRVKDAKWFISHTCLDTKQMLQVLEVFHRQDSKVQIAKFAYDYLNNSRDFLELQKSLKYDSDKDELKMFFLKRVEK